MLFKNVDSIFAQGYLTEKGKGINDTVALILYLGYDTKIESEVH